MLKLIAMAMGTTVVGLGAYASFDHQYNLEGRITYLVLAAVLVPLLAAFLPETFVTAWRRKHRLLAFCLFVVFVGCCAQVFLAAADRMHAAQAGPAAARAAARLAVADAEQAVTDAKGKATKAEADARAARKLPRAPANKKAAAGSFCDDGCLKRYTDEVTATGKQVADAANALTAARGKAVNDATLSPAVWLLPAVIDSAGIVLWTLVPLLPWPRLKTKPAKATTRRRKATTPKPRPTKPGAALRVGVFKPRVVA